MATNIGILKDILLVAGGGALGSAMRYGMTLLAAAMHISPMLGTFSTNAIGSLLIGLVISLTDGPSASAHLFGAVGLCGGFTTFSTFSSQTLNCIHAGDYRTALLYALGSVIVCVLFTAAGLWLGKAIKM